MTDETKYEAELRAFSRLAAEHGKLIEAGWFGLCVSFVEADDSLAEMAQLRMAFFAGAQHLFASIMGGILDHGGEPTEADLRRLDLIEQELSEFAEGFTLLARPPAGRS